MTQTFDVHSNHDMVVLAIPLTPPKGATLSWVLTPEEAIDLAEGLHESRSRKWDGHTFGQAGEYPYAVSLTKEGPPGMSLSLGLGKDAAEVTWSFAPEDITRIASALNVAADEARASIKGST